MVVRSHAGGASDTAGVTSSASAADDAGVKAAASDGAHVTWSAWAPTPSSRPFQAAAPSATVVADAVIATSGVTAGSGSGSAGVSTAGSVVRSTTDFSPSQDSPFFVTT